MLLFDIESIEDKNSTLGYIKLQSPNKKSHAKIALNLGASLQELSINDKSIIKTDDLDYGSSYASSVLFPFVNRVKEGKYTFDKNEYLLETNAKEEKNALHGLIYDKAFKVITKEITKDRASATLEYKETRKPKGFPFNYSIALKYTLTDTDLKLKVSVKNIDNKPFPFNIGWHPYFSSSDLYNSFIGINSNKKFVVDEAMIPVRTKDISLDESLQIKDNSFDDCFILNKNNVNFKTPDYEIELSTSYKENYLQVYTPKNRKHIAIEPTTAPANSFNNSYGLQILKPKETHKISWMINLRSYEQYN